MSFCLPKWPPTFWWKERRYSFWWKPNGLILSGQLRQSVLQSRCFGWNRCFWKNCRQPGPRRCSCGPDGWTPSGNGRHRDSTKGRASHSSHSGNSTGCDTRDHSTRNCSTTGCNTRNGNTRGCGGTRGPSTNCPSTRDPSMSRDASHSNCNPRWDSSTRGCRDRCSSTPKTVNR
jgi:hypothetical protein